MDLSEYDLEDLLLAAMKSEIDSKNLYTRIGKKIKNGLLIDKLNFLASEEEKHYVYVEDIYKNHYPEKQIKLPKETPVPLPGVTIKSEDMPISKIISMAMNAEQSAHDFYNSLATRFEDGSKINITLRYFADMENQHYKILEMEKESMERFEEADVYWPMVHAGP